MNETTTRGNWRLMPQGFKWKYVDRLEEELIVRDWTQEELAKRAGVSPAAINRLVRGQAVRPRTILAVCRALESNPVSNEITRFIQATA